MEDRKSTYLLLIQFILVILLAFYLVSRRNGAPVFLFWPIIWLIVLFAIICYKLPEKYRISSLILLELALTIIPMVSTPEVFQVGRDTLFESQFASITAREAKWDPSLGSGFAEDYYGYNPALHFALAFLSLVTGLTTFFLSKYIYIVILRITFVLVAYVLISTILTQKYKDVSYLATILFMASPRLMIMHVTRRLIAAVFLLLTIYALFKSQSSSRKLWLVLFIIFSSLIVLGDHTITYLFIIFMAGAIIFFAVTKSLYNFFFRKYKINMPPLLPEVIFFLGIWALWNIVITKVLIKVELSYITEIIRFAFTRPIVGHVSAIQSSAIHINYPYENFIIYISQAEFLLLGSIGLLLFLRKNKKQFTKHESLFIYFSLFGFFLYAFAAFLLTTAWDILPQNTLWLFSIPLCIFASYLFYILIERFPSRKIFLLIVLLFLLFYSGGLLLNYSPTIINRPPNKDIVLEYSDSKTQELYASGLWLKNRTSKATVLGDRSVSDIYSGFFEFDTVTDGYARDFYLLNDTDETNLFLDHPMLFGWYPHTMRYYSVDYVIINDAIFRYPSLLVGNPLDPIIRERINNLDLDRIYDNGDVQIYHNYKKG